MYEKNHVIPDKSTFPHERELMKIATRGGRITLIFISILNNIDISLIIVIVTIKLFFEIVIMIVVIIT